MKGRQTLAILPLALGLASQALHSVSVAPAAAATVAPVTAKAAAAKEFTVPVASLQAWSKSVVVTLNSVSVEGNSAVHPVADDCEIHFGAHDLTEFNGNPNGLVLEPMNACVDQPPKGFETWPDFAKSLEQGTPVAAAGVPRIWPEHLVGGAVSNPDHAVELHPLTSIVSGGSTFDLSGNIDAGGYHGKAGNQSIVSRVSAEVTNNNGTAEISFQGGEIGNFTTLDLLIDRKSIASDGAGSFRMTGNVSLDGKTFPVRIVTVKGSPINGSMPSVMKRPGPTEELDGALILYSLSPQALLDAANRSQGQAVAVDLPIQLILYGIPDSK